MDGKDEDLSHRSNRITTADARKTARSVRVASDCEFATHRGLPLQVLEQKMVRWVSKVEARRG
jgi:hypothetical protein